MLTAVAFILLMLQGVPVTDTCVSCHLEIGDEFAAPVEKVKNDVHGRRGLSCASCHGGDSNDSDPEGAMDPVKGFIGRPSAAQVQSFCGKCHTNAETMRRFNPALRVDQETEFRTSVHGERVAQGDSKAATCVSCHGNHGILAVSDPNSPVFPTHVAETCGKCHSDVDYMAPYGIPTDQAEKFNGSVHGEALLKNRDMSAPTCNDCHGNHGAAPPGAASVANVCGTCHARQSELFKESPHNVGFEALGLAECLECHGNHGVEHPHDGWVGISAAATCVKCHSDGDPGFAAASRIRQRLLALTNAIDSADSILQRASTAGMEVSRSRFELNDARDSLINTRVVVHGFSVDAVENASTSGLDIAAKAQLAGNQAMEELLFRRKGLAVSLIVIGLAIAGLFLKIREIEASSKTNEGGQS